MHDHTLRTGTSSEAGFTLAEALVAILILVVGLMAVTNLMVVGAQTRFIRVRSEPIGGLAGAKARAEFTTFRSCTAVASGCP